MSTYPAAVPADILKGKTVLRITDCRTLPIHLSTWIRNSAILQVRSTSCADICLRLPKCGGTFPKCPLKQQALVCQSHGQLWPNRSRKSTSPDHIVIYLSEIRPPNTSKTMTPVQFVYIQLTPCSCSYNLNKYLTDSWVLKTLALDLIAVNCYPGVWIANLEYSGHPGLN